MDIISKLKNEGVLKLYHDYRSGSLVDLSGNDNDGTPTSSKILNKKGNKTSYGATYQYIEVDDSSELNLTEGTLCVFGDFKTMSSTIGIMMAKRDSTSGLTFQLGRNTHGTLLDFHTTASASIAISANANCYSINFKTGSKPVVYTDGKLTGEMSAVSTVPTTAAKVYISGSPASGTWNDYESTYGAALMISRKLTATEHAQLFAQLQNTKYPSKVTAISKASTQVSNKPYISEELLTDGDMEASGVAAWSSHQATLTKETNNPHYGTQCLRVTATAATANFAYQQVISPNSTYRVTGWARSDGTNVPLVGDWATGARWTGTTSTDWQYFDLTFTPTSSLATRLTLGSYGADGNYVEFDDAVFQQVEPLTAGYNMKPVDGKIIDQSENGNDGVISGATYEKDKVVGDTLRFDGVNDNINLGSAIFSTSDANHTFTVMAWVYSDDYSQDDWVFTQYNAGAYRWTWGFESNTIRYFWNGTSKFSTGNLVNGTWNHIATSKDSSGNIKFYINGVHQGTEVLNGYFENVNTFMGSGANGVNWYAGLINSPKILKNVILSEDEILAEYNKVKNTGVSFKTDWGVKESVAIEGGVVDAQLSNSPFNFSTTTGRFKIISEDDIKAIACTTSGFIYHKVDCSEKEAAYGTWEFSVRGGTGSATTLYFISDTKTIAGGVSTYYAISYYGDDEYFKVTSYDTTTTSTKLNTGGHSYPKDTIHKVRITRDAAGIFHIYINGSLAAVSSGANTWTDNTVAITGKYMVVGQNASNNELFLSDKTGGHSIIKRNLA